MKYNKIFSIAKKMKKLYCVICSKCRTFEKPKRSYILKKILVVFIICCKCKNEDEKLFKEGESIELKTTPGFKKCKLIMQKRKKKHDKIVLLAKSK